MGKQTQVIVKITCDRCGGSDKFPAEEEHNSEFSKLRVEDYPDKWLCSGCQNLLYLFMMGQNTPAGIRFNVHEGLRLRYSVKGFLAEEMPEWIQP
jgi:hypothetical protein